MPKFYEVKKASIKNTILNWLEERRKVCVRRHNFAKEVGAKQNEIIMFSAWGNDAGFALIFEDVKSVDTTVWRRHRRDNRCWLPRKNTPVGKEMHKRMKELAISPLSPILDMLNYSVLDGVPGFREYPGKKLVLHVKDNYKPVDGLKRVSDLTVERWESKMKRKKSTKRPAKKAVSK